MQETILQLGAGRFLRAFVDRFVHQANVAGQNVGKVVVVQTTAGTRAEALGNPPRFSVLVRGYLDGTLIDRVDPVDSVSRALLAQKDWATVLELARSPVLRYLITNSTEAGFSLASDDPLANQPAQSMPAKVTQILWQRFQAKQPGLIILPCELIDRNGSKLLELVVTQAETWNLPREFETWLRGDCHWLNNLVDCIVTPPPADHPLLPSQSALVQAEPFTLWAIERDRNMPTLFEHPAIQIVEDLSPVYLRKVRILNGLHTAMAAKFLPDGFKLVKEVMEDKSAVRWVRGLLWEEIVPSFAYRVSGVADFAEATLDRLRNPFLEHKLADIALNHAAKVKVRLEPTRDEYRRLFDRDPPRLTEILNWRP